MRIKIKNKNFAELILAISGQFSGKIIVCFQFMINCLSYEYTLLENQAHQFGQFSFRIDHSFQNLNLFQFHFRLIGKIDLTVQILNSFRRQFQHLMALLLAGLLNVPDIAVRSQMVA